jgi:hypothetical protein
MPALTYSETRVQFPAPPPWQVMPPDDRWRRNPGSRRGFRLYRAMRQRQPMSCCAAKNAAHLQHASCEASSRGAGFRLHWQAQVENGNSSRWVLQANMRVTHRHLHVGMPGQYRATSPGIPCHAECGEAVGRKGTWTGGPSADRLLRARVAAIRLIDTAHLRSGW